MPSQPPTDSPPSPPGAPHGAAEQFVSNASLGLNQWWRWAAGLLAIVIAWLGLGILVQYAGCGLLRSTGAFGVTCSDSTIARLFLGGLGFATGIAGVWLVARVLHRKEFKRFLTGRKSFDWQRYLFGILVALVVSLATFLVNRFILRLEMTFQAPGLEFLTFLLFAIVLVPIQSGFEEVFFRAYILQGLMQFLRNRVVLAIAAGVIFMLPHLSNPEPLAYGFAPYVIALVSSGVFFSIMTLLDGGIEVAAGYHAMSNLFMGLVANTAAAAIESPSLFLIQTDSFRLFPDIFISILGLVLALAILNLKYRWIGRAGQHDRGDRVA